MNKKKKRKRLSLKKATVRKLTTKDLLDVQGGLPIQEGGGTYTNRCSGCCGSDGYTGACAYTGKCVGN